MIIARFFKIKEKNQTTLHTLFFSLSLTTSVSPQVTANSLSVVIIHSKVSQLIFQFLVLGFQNWELEMKFCYDQVVC